jgi:GTP cyclohydrolase I
VNQVITFKELHRLAAHTGAVIAETLKGDPRTVLRCYPVPRGGVPAALALKEAIPWDIELVDCPQQADFILDDLIDTGATELRLAGETPVPFFALIDKRTWEHGRDWVVWPWEGTAEVGIEDHIVRLLQYVGEDPERGGLAETPARVSAAWAFWCNGYDKDPADVLKVFEDGAEGVDEMVVVNNLPFYTHCEHHMAPFFGTATIAYLPNKKIVGLSKLSRVLDIFARRLQVQERLTCQVADALMQHLQPMGCGVVINARHLCMESRGICQQGHSTTTSALRGIFKTDASVRSEFLGLAK